MNLGLNIPVTTSDGDRYTVEATLVAFQTVSRVWDDSQITAEAAARSRAEGRSILRQEGLIFGICIAPDGRFLVKRLNEMRVVMESKDA